MELPIQTPSAYDGLFSDFTWFTGERNDSWPILPACGAIAR